MMGITKANKVPLFKVRVKLMLSITKRYSTNIIDKTDRHYTMSNNNVCLAMSVNTAQSVLVISVKYSLSSDNLDNDDK